MRCILTHPPPNGGLLLIEMTCRDYLFLKATSLATFASSPANLQWTLGRLSNELPTKVPTFNVNYCRAKLKLKLIIAVDKQDFMEKVITKLKC